MIKKSDSARVWHCLIENEWVLRVPSTNRVLWTMNLNTCTPRIWERKLRRRNSERGRVKLKMSSYRIIKHRLEQTYQSECAWRPFVIELSLCWLFRLPAQIWRKAQHILVLFVRCVPCRKFYQASRKRYKSIRKSASVVPLLSLRFLHWVHVFCHKYQFKLKIYLLLVYFMRKCGDATGVVTYIYFLCVCFFDDLFSSRFFPCIFSIACHFLGFSPSSTLLPVFVPLSYTHCVPFVAFSIDFDRSASLCNGLATYVYCFAYLCMHGRRPKARGCCRNE